jgi:hypothetical protein
MTALLNEDRSGPNKVDLDEIGGSLYGDWATALLSVVVNFSMFVHRRVERVEWVGERIVRRHILLDITPPLVTKSRAMSLTRGQGEADRRPSMSESGGSSAPTKADRPDPPGAPRSSPAEHSGELDDTKAPRGEERLASQLAPQAITQPVRSDSVGFLDPTPFPVAIFNKGEVIGFEAHDARSALLPYLNLAQNRRVTCRMLLDLITPLIGGKGLTDETIRNVWQVSGPKEEAAAARQRLLVELAPITVTTADPESDARRQRLLENLSDELVGQFYMPVLLRDTAKGRRVIEWTYDEYVVDKDLSRRWWRPQVGKPSIPHPGAAITMPVGLAETYHAEIQAPGGTQFPDQRSLDQYREKLKSISDYLSGTHARVAARYDQWQEAQAHSRNTRNLPVRALRNLGLWQARRRVTRLEKQQSRTKQERLLAQLVEVTGRGDAIVSVKSYRSLLNVRVRAADRTAKADVLRSYGLEPASVRVPLFVAWATAILLTGGLFVRLDSIHSRPEAAAAALVALPAIYVALLIRPGEHPVTKRHLRFVRWAAWTSGIVSFAAGASLAVDFPVVQHPEAVWLIGRPLAWFASYGSGLRGPVWGALLAVALGSAVTLTWVRYRLGRVESKVRWLRNARP